MKRRIFALIGAILLAGLYISTLVFALMKSELAHNLLITSIVFTIFVPVVLQCCIMIENIPNTVKQIADLMNVEDEKEPSLEKDESKEE
jgi:uncharacterized membrane protein YhfC